MFISHQKYYSSYNNPGSYANYGSISVMLTGRFPSPFEERVGRGYFSATATSLPRRLAGHLSSQGESTAKATEL